MLRPKTAHRAYGGFSLAELLVVMAILGLVALVGLPWWQRLSRRNQFRSAAGEIQTTLLAARMKAVRRNANASVVVVTAAPTDAQHLIETVEPDPPSPTPTPLPSGSVALSTAALNFVTLPAGNKITFDGNGRRVAPPPAFSADIVIQGPTGGSVVNTITIHTSITGRVEVVTPAIWQ
jgi:prepilin-type N-terminal cleavage/methylation domain-containing protein